MVLLQEGQRVPRSVADEGCSVEKFEIGVKNFELCRLVDIERYEVFVYFASMTIHCAAAVAVELRSVHIPSVDAVAVVVVAWLAVEDYAADSMCSAVYLSKAYSLLQPSMRFPNYSYRTINMTNKNQA